MPISENAKAVLERRYLARDEQGQPTETVDGLFRRVANAVAEGDRRFDSKADVVATAKEFYELMVSLDFLPNSPTLMNAGRPLGQLSACFVLPVADSMEDIFDAIKNAALIHKSGGGTGFSFSRLRPKGSTVNSTGGVASGPISFMKVFNAATEAVKQGGTRRGANMGILRVDHPDILEFITCKNDTREITNFNLSVGITEAFMEAVSQDKPYDLVDPATGRVVGQHSARAVFDAIVTSAWQTGEPGIIFLDRLNRDNVVPSQGEIESTNPCGEQPLLPYESCNLGSINLVNHLMKTPAGWVLDRAKLEKTIRTAVHFLDNVIEVNQYPLPEIDRMTRSTRKIGLGVMGFADLLFQLGIPYDSEAGIALAERIMGFINAEGHAASARLAEERGPFPAYAESVFPQRGEGPYRNATVTTIAPTGTLSIIGGCSSGVEPLFALCFTRNILDGERLVEVNPYFEAALKEAGLGTPELMEQVVEKGSIQSLDALPAAMRKVFVTAMDIDPVWHLRMQAAFQRHTDNAVSKTVNLPHSATEQDIHDIYWLAYKEGCKGVTVYRDGCKSLQVLATGEGQKKMDGEAPAPAEKPRLGVVRKRPDVVQGFTQKIQTGLGAMYLTVNEIDGKPFEVFATIGKSGRSITAKAEAIGRLVSLALRSGVEVRDIVAQIKGIGGEHPVFRGKGLLLSIPDAIAWVLERRYLKDEHLGSGVADIEEHRCPECDEPLVFQEGCLICPACGFSRCG